MKQRRLSLTVFLAVQLALAAVVAAAYVGLSDEAERDFRETMLRQEVDPKVPIERNTPLTIAPLYDDPSVVSEADLAAVLKKIRPKFPAKGRKPNFVEHALRAWGVSATFHDPAVMNGADLRDFLLDHGRYAASWTDNRSRGVEPLLIDRPHGVAVRWGQHQETSVHHDHLLACLTEAGVSRDQKVYAPSGRDLTVDDLIQEALRDFRLEEQETEWSTMAFALWLPPMKSWRTKDGRTVTFDMLADRLMRGQKEIGVCSGTHRVYSLMLLWRLDQEYDILSDRASKSVFEYLKTVRDLIRASQFPDGHWPPNWPDGRAAVENPRPDAEFQDVIATGHHLEWLAIAPPELHPPREVVQKAARWLIDNTTSKSDADIYDKYTFYSHVGNALALWRKTHPAEFWRKWTAEHPGYEKADDAPPPPIAPPPIFSAAAELKREQQANSVAAGSCRRGSISAARSHRYGRRSPHLLTRGRSRDKPPQHDNRQDEVAVVHQRRVVPRFEQRINPAIDRVHKDVVPERGHRKWPVVQNFRSETVVWQIAIFPDGWIFPTPIIW